MRYQIDHDYHIHTHLSSCCKDPEQTTENLLCYARKNGLRRICVTDHYWDSSVPGASPWYQKQNYDHIAQSLPLPREEGIEFLFGCETDLDKFMTLGTPPSRFDDFDFIVIPTTHLHMKGFTLEVEERYNDDRKLELWSERLDRLLDMDLPFGKIGIAHLACCLLHTESREGYVNFLDRIRDDDMERLFTKAASRGCGIELNQDDMTFSPDEQEHILRMFRIAKSCGCKFYLGSDSHRIEWFDQTREIFERAVTLLDLHESDKFHIH